MRVIFQAEIHPQHQQKSGLLVTEIMSFTLSEIDGLHAHWVTLLVLLQKFIKKFIFWEKLHIWNFVFNGLLRRSRWVKLGYKYLLFPMPHIILFVINIKNLTFILQGLVN